MFAGLGHQSEQRDANRRPTGRRHAPREMTTESGVPTFGNGGTDAARRASDQLREDQIRKANQGPSFMDQMFDKENKRNATQAQHGAGVNRPAGAPKDKLNVFAWDTHGAPAPTQPPQGPTSTTTGPAAAASTAARVAPADAEALRRAEARKFEENTNGNFLAFSDNRRGPQAGHHTGKKMTNGVSRQQATQPPYATGEAVGATSANSAAGRGKKSAPPQRQGDGATVQGFKGMGEQCSSKATGRKVGRQEPSNVFPPQDERPAAPNKPTYTPQRPIWLQHEDDDMGAPHISPASQPPPQQQQPQQRSVKFHDEAADVDVAVFDDDRYYADRDEAYFREQQMLYEEEQQQQQQDRRVPQFQRRNRQGSDGSDGMEPGY